MRQVGTEAQQRLGALQVNNDRSAQLSTMTAARNLKITLTPEASAGVRQPTHKPVMWAQVVPYK